MTADEMIKCARDQQRNIGRPDALVALILPGRWGRRRTRRLCPGGPSGRIVGDTVDGVIVMFKADEVIAAIEARR